MLIAVSTLTLNTLKAQTQKTLLWQIKATETSKPSYLFGTMHVVCPNNLQIDTAIKKAITNCTSLFLEMKLDDAAMMAKAQPLMMLSDTVKWKKYLSITDYKTTADSFLKYTKMPLDMLQTIKPFALFSILIPALMECQPVSLEGELMKIAKQNNIPIKGLETIERQMKAMDALSIKDQTTMLYQTLNNMDSSKSVLKTLLKFYVDKDVEQLQKITVSDANYGWLENSLLKQRNQEWVPIMEQQIQQQSTFFAVGAAHLAGKDGVITLLKNKGYTVTPIFY